MDVPKKKPHWYMMFEEYCPVCGGGTSWREIRYTPKPENKEERYSSEEVYNHCLEWEEIRWEGLT